MLMIPFLVLLALAPVAAVVWYVYAKDKHEKEPTKLLITCFALGVISIVPALFGSELGISLGLEESGNIVGTFLFAFFAVALPEELAKFIFLRYYIFPKKEFNEPYDGIIYAVMIGMGFAAFENIIYVIQGGLAVGVLRMFTAVPAHAVFGAMMGYYVGLAKMNSSRSQRNGQLAKGLGIAVVLHGLYDFFLFQQKIEVLGLMSFILLLLGIRYTQKAIAVHQQVSPFSAQNIALQQQQQEQEQIKANPELSSEWQTVLISTNELSPPTIQADIIDDDEQIII